MPFWKFKSARDCFAFYDNGGFPNYPIKPSALALWKTLTLEQKKEWETLKKQRYGSHYNDSSIPVGPTWFSNYVKNVNRKVVIINRKET